jgi:hypothetical protein
MRPIAFGEALPAGTRLTNSVCKILANHPFLWRHNPASGVEKPGRTANLTRRKPEIDGG